MPTCYGSKAPESPLGFIAAIARPSNSFSVMLEEYSGSLYGEPHAVDTALKKIDLCGDTTLVWIFGNSYSCSIRTLAVLFTLWSGWSVDLDKVRDF
jgi:hypothetical protein